MYDCAIIGGGIVGLATAMELGKRQPDIRVLLVEKEPDLALHQTGRNSGVITVRADAENTARGF